jgi:hypothetical protein
MVIKKINGKYLIQADRILVQLFQDETNPLRLMLTRRITIFLLRELDLAIKKLSIAKSKSPKKSQEKKPSNQKAFKPNQDAPIKLVVDVVMKSSSTMDERTAALTLIFSDKTKLNLNLNQHLITKIYGLIQSLEAKALWGISDRLADANLTTPKKEARHKLH